MLNAAAGMISFILSPMLTMLLGAGGLRLALTVLSVLAVILVPAAMIVTSRDKEDESSGETEKAAKTGAQKSEAGSAEIMPDIVCEPAVEETVLTGARTGVLRSALKNRIYLLLLAGFSTCGFHMVIIESHLYSQNVSYGLSDTNAGWAFSVYGIATIIGALLSGFLSTRLNKGDLLCFYYGFRAVWAALYIFLMPKTMFTAVLYAVGLGMTGDAIVSPTSGIVNANFRLKDVAMLIGLMFAVQQTGAFLSAWLGGIIVSATGGYTLLWICDIALCVMASACSFMIKRVKKQL